MSNKAFGVNGTFSLADFEPRSSGRHRKPVERFSNSEPANDEVEDDNEESESSSDHESSQSESGSDWGTSGKRKKRRTKKPTRRKRSSRKMRSSSDDDDDDDAPDGDRDAVRAASGLRSVGRTKYQEFDEDEFADYDDWDWKVEQYRMKQKAAAEADMHAINMVLDRRIREKSEEDDDIDDDDDDGEPVYEYLINWKHQSHIHNMWHTREELRGVRGFQRLTNFIKRKDEQDAFYEDASPEDLELLNIDLEMTHQVQMEWCTIDRLIDMKLPSDEALEEVQYLVKWTALPYIDATWEVQSDIKDIYGFERCRVAMMEREKSLLAPDNKWPPSKPRKFVELKTQPEWLRGGELRDYQVTGLNWLIYSWCKNLNCILADEMGLGKTIQVVTFLAYLICERQIARPHLVVVPLSTMTAWKREFTKWAPWVSVIEYTGDSKSRERVRETEFYRVPNVTSGRRRTKSVLAVQVLLTTYEIVLKDQAYLQPLSFKHLVVDEAHRLKDSSSQLYQVLSGFKTTNRLLITGTPLQNSMQELWNLLHFLHPDRFDNLQDWEAKYGGLEDGEDIRNLHEELKPHLLRRVKKDVEKSLPAKLERILRVEMTQMQRKYYRWIAAKNYRELNKGVKGKRSSLNNIAMEMKKCCNHPYLFENAETEHRNNFIKKAMDKGLSQEEATQRFHPLRGLVKHSGKMKLLSKLLARLKETGHRVLIFTQMVRMLDILSDFLRMSGYCHQRLDGSMNAKARQLAMDRFNDPESKDFCFILSTRAGGLGINLATADTVIIFDSDWNPQNDLQAEARAHRIGQTKAVNIYRLLTQNSVEERILERGKQKMVLDHLVIQRMDTTARYDGKKSGASLFDNRELVKILQFGAEELFKEDGKDEQDDDDNEKDDAQEFNLDELLARAETHETKAGGETEEFLSAFKVATFTNDAVEDDADEPDFWARIIPKDQIPEDQLRDENEVKLWLPPRATRTHQVTYNEKDLIRQQQNTATSHEQEDEEEIEEVYTVDDVEEKDIRALARYLTVYGDVEYAVNEVQRSSWKRYKLADVEIAKVAHELLSACRKVFDADLKKRAEQKAQALAERKKKQQMAKNNNKSGENNDNTTAAKSKKKRAAPIPTITFRGAELKVDMVRQFDEMVLLRTKVEESIKAVTEVKKEIKVDGDDDVTGANDGDQNGGGSAEQQHESTTLKQESAVEDEKSERNDAKSTEDNGQGLTGRALNDFRVNIKCQKVAWNVSKWGSREDSRLLLGVYMFGRGGSVWDKIVNEPGLGLRDILAPRSTPDGSQQKRSGVVAAGANEFAMPTAVPQQVEETRLVSNAQLRGRVNTLLKNMFLQHQKAKEEALMPKVENKRKKRAKSTTSRKRKSSSSKSTTAKKRSTKKSTKRKSTKSNSRSKTKTSAKRKRGSTKSAASKRKSSSKAADDGDTAPRRGKKNKVDDAVDDVREESPGGVEAEIVDNNNKNNNDNNNNDNGVNDGDDDGQDGNVESRDGENDDDEDVEQASHAKRKQQGSMDNREGPAPKRAKKSGKTSKRRVWDENLLLQCKTNLMPVKKELKALHKLKTAAQVEKAKDLMLVVGDRVQDLLVNYARSPDYDPALKVTFEDHLWHFLGMCVKCKTGAGLKSLYNRLTSRK